MQVLDLGPLGRDERDGATYQLQETGSLKAPADVVAARADVAVCRTSREQPAGHFIERRAEHSAAKVGSEPPPDQRVAQILLPEAPHFLVEVVAIRLQIIGSRPDAKPRVGGLDLVQHLPRVPVVRRGRRQDRDAWEMLDKVEAAYTGLCVGTTPDGLESDRDYLDEEMGRLGQKDLSDPLVRRRFRTNLRRRVLRAALDEVARRLLPARATDRDIRARGDDIRRRLQRAGLLKLVGGSVPFISPEGTEI